MNIVKKHDGCEVYYVKTDSDFSWGIIVVDEHTGLFIAYTDFGTFSHHWSAPGEKGLKHFLTDIDYSYAMGKFRGGDRGTVYDAAEAVKNIKRAIISNRHHRFISKDTARKAWETLRYADDYSYTKDTLQVWVRDQDSILDAIGHDEWWYSVDGRVKDPQCVAFWNDIFIPFVSSYCPDHKVRVA